MTVRSTIVKPALETIQAELEDLSTIPPPAPNDSHQNSLLQLGFRSRLRPPSLELPERIRVASCS